MGTIWVVSGTNPLPDHRSVGVRHQPIQSCGTFGRVLLYYVSSTVILLKPNPSSGVPIYLQLVEQVKHAVETGALRPGEQLPSIRPLAEELVVNPNTVAKAYRELEHQGVIELRHGAGAFVASSTRAIPADAMRA